MPMRPGLTKWQKKLAVWQTFRKFVAKVIPMSGLKVMRNRLIDSPVRRLVTYLVVMTVMNVALYLLPKEGGYMWDPWLVNTLTAMLFTLLIWLTARLARTDNTILGILCTAAFVILFCPGADRFFLRDETGLQELASQCMVPFFIGQFRRIRTRDFHRWYALMLLMGIFCSYTHNGITIPMCATFLFLSFQNRDHFFRLACWPMVTGVVIGTGISIWQLRHDATALPTDIQSMTSVTSIALTTLWDTKVFVIAVAMTLYLTTWHQGRRKLLYTSRRHYVVSLCTFFSLCTMPFAPLGIENAVTGVCFFCMFWVLLLCRSLIRF